MPSTPTGPDTGRYIIRSDDLDRLAEFIQSIHDDPEIKLVDTIGPAGHVHTAVVTMSPEKASSLEQRFHTGSPLKIEPDRPLSLFGDTQD